MHYAYPDICCRGYVGHPACKIDRIPTKNLLWCSPPGASWRRPEHLLLSVRRRYHDDEAPPSSPNFIGRNHLIGSQSPITKDKATATVYISVSCGRYGPHPVLITNKYNLLANKNLKNYPLKLKTM